ncbi:MAG: response regulator [Anaerolineae bacterium]|nr:response regulator [Anaerolineae bacterium]
MEAHILIVDDDKNLRYILAKYVKRLGHTVIEAESGEEALRILRSAVDPIDLVLTDIWMPELNGIELLQAVRHIAPDLPVAMITGAATLDSSIAALNAGAYAYLTKPIRSEQVRDVVERGLQRVEEARLRQAVLQGATGNYRDGYLASLEGRQQDMANAANDDLLAELIRGIRHELGNTTTAIKLNLAVLEEEGSNPRNLREHLLDLQASTDGLVTLLAKLKEYPRQNLIIEVIELRQILQSTVDMAERDMNRRGVQLIFDVPEHEILVEGALLELSRALTHLLNNAIEAASDAKMPRVEVSAVVDDSTVTIAISDNGAGFPDTLPEGLFSPGYTTKLNGGTVRGLGMGLFIARAIILLHNGKIWLENREAGGASVHIQLPLAQAFE